ncbi:hypothetical protein D3C75_1156160 [compost metagenome]
MCGQLLRPIRRRKLGAEVNPAPVPAYILVAAVGEDKGGAADMDIRRHHRVEKIIHGSGQLVILMCALLRDQSAELAVTALLAEGIHQFGDIIIFGIKVIHVFAGIQHHLLKAVDGIPLHIIAEGI